VTVNPLVYIAVYRIGQYMLIMKDHSVCLSSHVRYNCIVKYLIKLSLAAKLKQ